VRTSRWQTLFNVEILICNAAALLLVVLVGVVRHGLDTLSTIGASCFAIGLLAASYGIQRGHARQWPMYIAIAALWAGVIVGTLRALP